MPNIFWDVVVDHSAGSGVRLPDSKRLHVAGRCRTALDARSLVLEQCPTAKILSCKPSRVQHVDVFETIYEKRNTHI